ncbi:response regulator receiver domain [Sphingobium sp. WTD-1]|uniref:response regulator receiver domain n=2 Tax=Pseudomonadota TaxID=1224 RepID=UPI0012BB201A|nr:MULTISPECIES: response regulator receiver domain [Sphingomonadaceae]QGP77766.1 hypothetical protein GL174_01220 [Sphingobium sp. CAP-1]QKR98444.1 hypothetical protein F9288_01380 [Sphingomonas sp. CL5.1]WIA57783.1 response regulator receiver domain [Sphingobium sp. WTD-1]
MELEAFEARFADAVERSFRDDAIRTAVLIDDQFPDYLRMSDATDEEFSEIARAKHIYGFMHAKGLICDIQNWRVPDDMDVHLLDKARKSDLILLDYQLGAAGSKTALKILRHLAVSSHFNLVVLYTAEANANTALTVATAMRGLAPVQDDTAPSPEILEAAEDILAEERFYEIDAPGLRDYLTDGKIGWNNDLRQSMQTAGIHLSNLKSLADYVARQWIATLVDDYEPDASELPLGLNIGPDQPMWVHCGSCFVAIVQKLPSSSEEDEGEYVWGRLGSALRAWKPNIYRLILSEIQNALELEAVAHHENWLDDDLSLGLGLYLLESDEAASGVLSPSDIEGSAQSLIDRFVDIIRRRLATHDGISRTANDLLSARLSTTLGTAPAGESARRIRARELAHIAADRSIDWQQKVVPAVNAFMVSDAFRGGHVTTGTVLRDADDAFWLCASPACDLVPREDGPIVVQLIKLEKTGAPPERFTPGEFVVVGSTREITILRALDKKGRQPALTMLVLPGGTRVSRDGGRATTSGWFATEAGLRAASAAQGFPAAAAPEAAAPAQEIPAPVGENANALDIEALPELPGEAAQADAPFVLEIVAQLRSAFATRFLMAAGQHQSRIGVDYVDP